MKNQSGSVGLCFIFLVTCVSVYAVAYYGCNYMGEHEDNETVKVEVIQLTNT